MNENRLADYLAHMQQAALDACAFVEGMAQDDFRSDKRTQQACKPVFVNIVVRFFKQLSAFFPSLVSLAPARG